MVESAFIEGIQKYGIKRIPQSPDEFVASASYTGNTDH
jgi:hypothetical protein